MLSNLDCNYCQPLVSCNNNYYGTGNSNNATITYQYDSWGNLLYKRTYAYTTGTLGTVQETVTYTYGNSSWKDRIETIEYGNYKGIEYGNNKGLSRRAIGKYF